MIVFCILRQIQFKIFVLTFIDIKVFVHFFMNKFFAQYHRFSLISLIYSRRFRDFDDQIALIENIIHVVETIMILKDHIEILFFYVTNLNQYLIIMSLFWLRRHDIDVNFEFNTLIMFSFFCLIHCCFNSIKIFEITREEKNFWSLKKSQRIWELENQETLFNINQVISFDFVLFLKKQLNSMLVHKKQFVCEKQFNNLIVHKKQLNIIATQKKFLKISILVTI